MRAAMQLNVIVSERLSSATPIKMKRKLTDIVPRIFGSLIFKVDARQASSRYPRYRSGSVNCRS
jgi:hypothetical protein